MAFFFLSSFLFRRSGKAADQTDGETGHGFGRLLGCFNLYIVYSSFLDFKIINIRHLLHELACRCLKGGYPSISENLEFRLPTSRPSKTIEKRMLSFVLSRHSFVSC